MAATAAATHEFVVVDGLRLHVLDWAAHAQGERPIVLIHGAGGSAWMWAHLAPVLAELGRPVALDLRGFGDSQWSVDHAYGTDRHRDDLAAVADALALGRADVVGFSWGGLVGLSYAAAHPDRVRRLVIVDLAPSSPLSETALPPGVRGRFADHADAVAAMRGLAPRAPDEVLETVAAFDTRSHPDGGLVTKRDPFYLERWPFRAEDHWDELRAIEHPTLVLHAADSQALAADEARRMVAEARNATLVTIPDTGHLIALEQPAALARALGEFLGAED